MSSHYCGFYFQLMLPESLHSLVLVDVIVRAMLSCSKRVYTGQCSHTFTSPKNNNNQIRVQVFIMTGVPLYNAVLERLTFPVPH